MVVGFGFSFWEEKREKRIVTILGSEIILTNKVMGFYLEGLLGNFVEISGGPNTRCYNSLISCSSLC